MSQIIPLLPIPKQHLSVQIADQLVEINVRQLRYGLYMDVLLNGAVVVSNAPCENLNLIVRSKYLNFAGDFAFWDTQGNADPDYTGLGGRFQLRYLSTDDLAQIAADYAAQAA